ncbi:MAG: hypothetical protein ACOYLE_02850 [Bacteroidales bacterium]
MHIDNFIKRLEKTRLSKEKFDFKLGKGLLLNDFIAIEKNLNITIPDRIKDFYLVANGLKTKNPDFEILEIDSWVIDSGLIYFATFDTLNKVYFDISKLNQADEWTILTAKDNYVMTLTISSFWSNKIWHWIEQEKMIWVDNWWVD